MTLLLPSYREEDQRQELRGDEEIDIIEIKMIEVDAAVSHRVDSEVDGVGPMG